jgi:hypothetical protein
LIPIEDNFIFQAAAAACEKANEKILVFCATQRLCKKKRRERIEMAL